MPLGPVEVEEEELALKKVIATFQQYGIYAIAANNRRRKDIYTLPSADQELLGQLGYKKKLAEVDNAILANAEFVKLIVANTQIFGGAPEEDVPEEELDGRRGEVAGPSRSHGHSHSHGGHSHDHGSHGLSRRGPRQGIRPTDADMDKLRSTIKQFVRDWSEEGKAERDVCYKPMVDALLENFKDIPQKERSKLRVLVPGAGLCRLAWDVANQGFACQANEFSHYMLLGSFFILNRTDRVNQHTIYPYIHSFSNIRDKPAMLRAVSFPDVSPSSLPPGSNFSLVAGDFEEIYGNEDEDSEEPQAGLFNAILTCFFIDTAKNIVNYLRVIHRKLAPGGVWINLGPLLWHWENNTSNDPSIELSLEEVKTLAQSIGFEITNEREIETTYTNNAQSMLGYVYHAAFFIATKVG
ncbi:N2227-domain-containing protein [Cytidiella melzeri]|nr:N2227-domain-containing protein [Cytidiella melzeri]